MEESIIKVILNHGVLGAVTLLALWWAWRLYRDREKLRESYEKQVAALHSDHREDLKAMAERYATKADSWIREYQELTREALGQADRMERRFGR